MKRDNLTLPVNISADLLIDNFAGGGASTGIEQDFGRPVEVATRNRVEAVCLRRVAA